MMIEGVPDPIQQLAHSAGSKAPHAVETAVEPSAANRDDAIELSALAQARLESSERDGVRKELVARVRSEIAAGTYLTDDKLDFVIERLRRLFLNVA